MPIDQEQFHAVDKIVMGYAFGIHNSLGKFCDEKIYQSELCTQCRNDFDVQTEVYVSVVYQDFLKKYFLDMLVNNSIIYELKTAKKIDSYHQKQLINYLHLTGINHGKLLNFRPNSVEYRFVSTTLSTTERFKFNIKDKEWHGDDIASKKLYDILFSLLNEWGAFLDINLYKEALEFFMDDFGFHKPVEIIVNGKIVGTQRMHVIAPDIAWHISSIKNDANLYENHIKRLLNHTTLRTIQWININNRLITLKTIRKK